MNLILQRACVSGVYFRIGFQIPSAYSVLQFKAQQCRHDQSQEVSSLLEWSSNFLKSHQQEPA